MLKENIRDLLKDLTQIQGISGQEQLIGQTILCLVTPYVDDISIMPNGNIVAVKKGMKKGSNLMLATHMDEIGFVVKNILSNGFILFEKIGGPRQSITRSKSCHWKKNIPGVIGNKPGHLQSANEAKIVKSSAECYIDVAMFSREEVEKSGISIGDQIVWTSDFLEMNNPDFIATKAIDNRVGCAIIIELLRNITKADFLGTLYCVFTVQEEVGLFGAQTVTFDVPADYAIAIDTIPCGDTPDVDTEIELPVRLNSGPVLPMADDVSYGFCSFIYPAIKKIIEDQAKKLSIELQKVIIMNGMYTTDGTALSHSNGAMPAGTLAIPRRYSHSPIELVSLNDVVSVYKIVEEIIKNNESAKLNFI